MQPVAPGVALAAAAGTGLFGGLSGFWLRAGGLCQAACGCSRAALPPPLDAAPSAGAWSSEVSLLLLAVGFLAGAWACAELRECRRRLCGAPPVAPSPVPSGAELEPAPRGGRAVSLPQEPAAPALPAAAPAEPRVSSVPFAGRRKVLGSVAA